MSATTHDAPTMPLPEHVPGDVHGYALAVRAQLADLPTDVVDELTDGLEADLAEALADAVGPHAGALALADVFDPPETYATELRAAAGIPPASQVAAKHGLRAATGARAARASARWHDAWEPLTRTSQWAAVLGFLRVLVPAWWVLRAWTVFVLVSIVGGVDVTSRYLPDTFPRKVLLVGFVVLSVQWGRGSWKVRRVPRWLRVVATGVLVVASLVCADGAARAMALTDTVYVSSDDGLSGPGVYGSGYVAQNLFVYDSEGNPIEGAQVFDDRGQPVLTSAPQDAYDWTSTEIYGLSGRWYYEPAATEDGREVWNAYPLQVFGENDATTVDAEGDDTYTDEELVPDGPEALRDAPRPFEKIAPLVVPESAAPEATSAPSDTVTDAATGAPSDGASGSPTDSASGAASAGTP